MHLNVWMNREAHRYALLWAKEHLPRETYQTIQRSYDTTWKRTLLFALLCLIPLMLAFFSLIFFAPFSQSEDALPAGASEVIEARVDYDGNFYWTHDSQVYEHPLEAYGLSAQELEVNDRVQVYVDEAQNVVRAEPLEEGTSMREIEIGAGVIGGILAPVLITLCIYLPIANRTFAKPWRTFYQTYCHSDSISG